MKTYILTQNYKSPYVVSTGNPRNPQAVKMKGFKKGEIIRGELKHANNKPAFVLVAGTLVVPLSVVKELTTKEIVSDASGDAEKSSVEVTSPSVTVANKKLQYVDAILIGGVLGFGAVFLAEKQGWLTSPDKKNQMYGALGGALIGAYLVFRKANQVVVTKKTND